jgi:hypothetical protein
MDKLREKFQGIPWDSFGRPTPISELSRSVLPVGNFPARLPSRSAGVMVALGEQGYENYLMDIQGTAFQVGRGKLLTCWHVLPSARCEKWARIYSNNVATQGWRVAKGLLAH